ncbi:tRNA(Ser) Um(44) 2'-O-methyltransferase [Balamuthia mandrillaris]
MEAAAKGSREEGTSRTARWHEGGTEGEEWVEVARQKTQITVSTFWFVMQHWALNPKHLMKPIKKWHILRKEIRDNTTGELLDATEFEPGEGLEERDGGGADVEEEIANNETYLAGEATEEEEEEEREEETTSWQIAYKRHLFPRVPEKDNEIDDWVVLFPAQRRVEVAPVFPPSEEQDEEGEGDEREKEEEAKKKRGKKVDPFYLPFFYPKVLRWAFVFHEGTEQVTEEDEEEHVQKKKRKKNEQKKTGGTEKEKQEERTPKVWSYVTMEAQFIDEKTYRNHLPRIAQQILKKLNTWGKNHEEGYKKRMHFDRIFSKSRYQLTYERLKPKYVKWVSEWTANSDPIKYVFEDIQIASYLISLWEFEQEELNLARKQSFVDLGCGNGFLVYILMMEGYPGKGLDLRRRDIWAEYPTNIAGALEEVEFHPETGTFPEYDWLLGNHSDELTPWIPLMASRSGWATKYFILPCCFFALEGGRYQRERLRQKEGKNEEEPTGDDGEGKANRKEEGKTKGKGKRIGTDGKGKGKGDEGEGGEKGGGVGSRYEAYLEYLKEIGEKCGYVVESDTLRIPSTRNLAQIGRKRTFPAAKEEEEEAEGEKNNKQEAKVMKGEKEGEETVRRNHEQLLSRFVEFVPRKMTDSKHQRERAMRQRPFKPRKEQQGGLGDKQKRKAESRKRKLEKEKREEEEEKEEEEKNGKTERKRKQSSASTELGNE